MRNKERFPPMTNDPSRSRRRRMDMSTFRKTPDIIMAAVAHRGGKKVAEKVMEMFRGSQYDLPGYDAWKTSPPAEPEGLIDRLENIRDSEIWDWLESNWKPEYDDFIIEQVLNGDVSQWPPELQEDGVDVVEDILRRANNDPAKVPEWLVPSLMMARDALIEWKRDPYEGVVEESFNEPPDRY